MVADVPGDDPDSELGLDGQASQAVAFLLSPSTCRPHNRHIARCSLTDGCATNVPGPHSQSNTKRSLSFVVQLQSRRDQNLVAHL